MNRKVKVFIAVSLDGYIAKPDGNIDFLSIVEIAGEDYGYTEFVREIDTVIWGRKTFDKVLDVAGDVPYKDKAVYIASKSREGKHGHAVYHSDVVKLVTELKQEKGKDIYCDGGSEIVAELLRHSLIDCLIVSIVPHLLGEGIRLFSMGLPEKKLRLRKSVAYPPMLVQLWYDVVND